MKELLELLSNKLNEPKYQKGREDGKVVTWRDFTKLINELLEKVKNETQVN